MTKKIFTSAIISLYLQQPISAKNYLDDLTCGHTIDLSTYQISKQPLENTSCTLHKIKPIIIKKIVKIPNYQSLFKIIGIDNFYMLYHSHKGRKFLNDTDVNAYTLTYLIYKKVVNFKNSIDYVSDIQNKQKIIIQEKEIGGEFISLIHIKTASKSDYEKIEKKLNKDILSFKHIDQLYHSLTKLSQLYPIKIKNYITENLPLYPTDNLEENIKNVKNFENIIKGEGEVIKINTGVHKYSTQLDSLTNLYNLKNNIFYITKHSNEFKLNKPLAYYLKKYNELEQATTKKRVQDQNLTSIVIKLPSRHRYSAEIPPIVLPKFSYKTKPKSMQGSYKRINDAITLHIFLSLKEEIRRRGKVLIETINIKTKADNKLIINETNSNIKLDTYINYPTLLMQKINNNRIGTLDIKFKLDKYKQEKNVKGRGLIKKAKCGYELINNKIIIHCDNIELKPLNINFKHQENK